MGTRVEEDQLDIVGSWRGLRLGTVDFGDLSLKDLVTSLRDWKSAVELWPETWQRKSLGEQWDWRKVWINWKKMRTILPSKMWVVWWRVLRRNVMLRNRTGWWAEEGRGCQICGVAEEGGMVQSPEHLLQECAVSLLWWTRVDGWAGWSAVDVDRGRRSSFQFWMLPGESYWRNIGIAVAWWVQLRWHWAWVFEKTGWPGEEMVLKNWREEMAIILTGVRSNRPKVWDRIVEEAGDRVYIVGDRVVVGLGWGNGKKGRPRGIGIQLLRPLGEPN